jgi:hypothetical protein
MLAPSQQCRGNKRSPAQPHLQQLALLRPRCAFVARQVMAELLALHLLLSDGLAGFTLCPLLSLTYIEKKYLLRGASVRHPWFRTLKRSGLHAFCSARM